MPATIQTILKPTRARGLDTSGNNNNAQIYSGRALEFDGVTDYLTADGVASLADSDFTVAIWIKPTLDGYTGGPGGRILFSFHDSSANNRLFFYITGSDNNIRAYSSSGADLSNTTGALSGSWERLVITKEGTSLKFYRNGVANGTSTLRDTVSGSAKFSIGQEWDGSAASDFYLGMMSDFQIWNSVWTAADAEYDYLNPEQLALNRGGTSLTNSNLKLWYPMNEGHRGDQSFVLDASNTGIGDDIVNWSSTFNDSGTSTSNFGDWTTNADNSTTFCTFDHDNKTIRIRSTDGSHIQAVYVPEILKYGTTYKFEFTVSELTNGSVRVRPQNTTEYLSVSEVGTYSYIVSPENSVTDLDFRIERDGTAAADFTISDVKIFPINDKNSATTVFYGDELSTTANNRTFAGSGNWTAYNSGAVDVNSAVAGKMQITVDGGGTAQGAQLTLANMGSSIVAGRTYRVQADLDFISGSDTDLKINFVIGNTGVAVKASDGSPSDGTITTTEQTYYADIVAGDASGALRINCTSATNNSGSNNVFTVDNVSVKEVGVAAGWTDADQQLDVPQTALQSYNQLGFSYGSKDTAGGSISCGSITSGAWTTLDIWFFPQKLGYNQGLLDQIAWNGDDADPSTGGYGFRVTISTTDKIVITRRVSGTANSNSMTSTNKINIGEWNHVAVVIPKVNGTSMRMMVNGHYEQATSSGDHGVTAKDFRLGYGGGIHYDSMPGCIAQASYFKAHMSESEMLELYNEGTPIDSRNHSIGTANLAGYWRNNGIYGNTWTNLANPGTNDGTPGTLITETMLITAGVDSSRDSQGFFMNRQRTTNSFNLTTPLGEAPQNNYGLVPTGSGTSPGDNINFIGSAFSFTCWVKLESPNTSQTTIIFDRGDGTDGFLFKHSSGRLAVFTVEKDNTEVSVNTGSSNNGGLSSGAMTVGTWYFVSGTHEGLTTSADMKIYVGTADVEAVNIGTNVNGVALDNSAQDLYLGSRFNKGLPFSGELDDLCFYDKELSEDEVLRNYNAGKRSHR